MGMVLRRPSWRRIAAAFTLTCVGIAGVGATDTAADSTNSGPAAASSKSGATVYIVQMADDPVVAYKGGRHMPAVLDVLRRHDRLDGAVYGSALGLPDQQLGAAADAPAAAPYLSTVIVPARRTTRGGKL